MGVRPRAPDRSGHCRTSIASSRSQRALPDLNCKLQITVGTAGPQPRAPDRSGHCRPNREPQIQVGTAGPPPRAPDPSGHGNAHTGACYAVPD
eukprot:s714_g15.t1